MTAVSGYNNLGGEPIFQVGLTYGNRFWANQNIGLMFSGSYQKSNRGSDNNEMERGYVEDASGNDIPWALQNMELRDYSFVRNRMILSGTADYLLKPGHQFYVNGLFSKYEDSESRRALVTTFDGDDIIYNSAYRYFRCDF